MNEREILAQRELVSSYLLDNLHKYGNIEPPGFYGRPMRGFGEYVSLTAKANYLRVSAWLTESSPKSPNFLTESQVKALNAVIKSDAVPVYGILDGQQAGWIQCAPETQLQRHGRYLL